MEPLQEPERQIRLLRLLPGGPDDDIRCEMSVHALGSSTREYLAISYTWGDTADPHKILIDGRPRMVRQNCQYALWQARCHYPGTFVWIDALSIDQDNVEEKSCQVKMMSKIFTQSAEVLACVGRDDGDSDFLWNFSKAFTYQPLCPGDEEAYDGFATFRYPTTGTSCEQIWNEWEADNPEETLVRFLKACDNFMNRNYWQRLWVLQELALARSIRILCGNFNLPWTITRNLCLLETFKKAQVLLPISAFCFTTVSSLGPSQAIERIVSALSAFKCLDVRDRIFGTLGLITFNDKALPIEPDYSKSAFEIAITITRNRLQWRYINSLLRTLRIDMRCPELQELIAKKGHKDTSDNSRIPSYPVYLWHSRLRTDAKGRLTCSLASSCSILRDTAMLDLIASASDARTLFGISSECSMPQQVYAGEEPAIILGSAAREGDYLAEVDWHAGLYLVLRRRTGNRFDIVCQGFSLRAHWLCCNECDCADRGLEHDVIEDQRFVTNLDIEDTVVLIGMDLGFYEPYNRTARLRRLITPVSSHPEPVAIMEDLILRTAESVDGEVPSQRFAL